MALDLGSLVAHIKVDDRDATSSLTRFDRAAQSTGTSAAGKLSSPIMGAVKRIGGVLAGAFALDKLKDVATFGLQVAASNEQAQISFTTMLGSAQKAGAFIKDLQAFAAKTPFDFPGLQKSASSLISAGINANKVIPIMKTLGDVTSGMGTGADGIQRATVALQQMNAAQKISGEDLNQLRDAGIPVYDLLSKALGKTKGEVVKLAQSGGLGKDALDKMMGALQSGKGLERFSGLMDKQSQSLTGLWSTIQDTFGQGFAQAIGPAIPTIKKWLTDIGNSIGPAMKRLGAGFTKALDFGGRVAGALKPAINAVRLFIGSFTGKGSDAIVPDKWMNPIIDAGAQARTMFDRLVGVLKAVFGFVKDTGIPAAAAFVGFLIKWRGVLEPIAAGVLAIAGAIKAYRIAVTIASGVSKAFAAVQAVVNAVMYANPIGIVVLAIVGLVAAFTVAYKKSETFRKIVDGAMHGVKKAVVAVVDWVKGSFIPFFTKKIPAAFQAMKGAISKAFHSAFDPVIKIAKSVWSGIEKVFQVAFKVVKGYFRTEWKVIDVLIVTPIRLAIRLVQLAWGKITDLFKAAYRWVSGAFKAAWGKIRDVLQGPIQKVKTWISAFWEAEKRGWRNIASWVTGTFRSLWNRVKDVLVGPIKAAAGLISDIFGRIRTTFGNVRDWVRGTWSRSWSAIKGKMTGPISSARSAISSLMGRGSSGIQTVFSRAVSAIGGIWDKLKNVAKAPIRFVVDTVLNRGLIDAYNKLAHFSWGNTSHNLAHLSLPRGFDTGGYTGPGHRKKPAGIVHAGEVVWDQDAVAKAGGPKQANALRLAAKAGKLDAVLGGYDGGGIVGTIKGAASSVAHFIKSGVSSIGNLLSDPAKFLGSVLSKAVTVGAGIMQSPMAQTFAHLPGKIIAGLVGKIKDAVSSILPGGGRAIVSWHGGRFTENFQKHLARAYAMSPFSIFQGGWNPGGVSASGTTHDRDAVDVGPATLAVRDALRKNGLAAWIRTPAEGFIYHIHGVPLPGAGTPSPQAAWQAQDYLRGGNGLLRGTSFATAGIHALSEDGRPELVIGPQYRRLKSGSQVLNASDTAKAMAGAQINLTIQGNDIKDPDEMARRASVRIGDAMTMYGLSMTGVG